MPIYSYRCPTCNIIQEEYRATLQDRDWSLCDVCARKIGRAHDREVPAVRSDVKPHYNVSLGSYVTSRKDIREQLAFHNAAMDLPTNSYPSAGRLCAEERSELVESGASRDIFDKRKDASWRTGVTSGNHSSSVDENIEVTVEGKADYQAIRDQIKKDHYGNKQIGG